MLLICSSVDNVRCCRVLRTGKCWIGLYCHESSMHLTAISGGRERARLCVRRLCGCVARVSSHLTQHILYGFVTGLVGYFAVTMLQDVASRIVGILSQISTQCMTAAQDATCTSHATRTCTNDGAGCLKRAVMTCPILLVPLGGLLLGVIWFMFRRKISSEKKDGSGATSRWSSANLRDKKELPPVFPNGWFRVCDSKDVKTGEVKGYSLLGTELAVYRGQDKHVYIIDAYCPHLGANISIGGEVIGNCIRCPFHGWTFNAASRRCVNIPYSASNPKAAKAATVKTWMSLEVNCIIYVWHDAEGREPHYSPMPMPGIDRGVAPLYTLPLATKHRPAFYGSVTAEPGTWRYLGVREHIIHAHVEDISENAADVGHLQPVHGPFMGRGGDVRTTNKPGALTAVDHEWRMEWKPLPMPFEHCGTFEMSHYVRLFGFRVPWTYVTVQAVQVGPGSSHLYFEHFLLGKVALLHEVTPLEPLMQRMIHQAWGPWWMPAFLGEIFLWIQCSQISRDVMIWNHKRYVASPPLVEEDRSILQHRTWYRQFYSESSPCLASTEDTSVDW
ncbi:cholesterol 7-desaturase nvd-like [Sycon ciliatum]|uniref:cholesterol 7-desaturase nvd-like n=1 Tax=Sycon ciliatum TaxID=27933 RepID=UPI0031F6E924